MVEPLRCNKTWLPYGQMPSYPWPGILLWGVLLIVLFGYAVAALIVEERLYQQAVPFPLAKQRSTLLARAIVTFGCSGALAVGIWLIIRRRYSYQLFIVIFLHALVLWRAWM